jgi:hypothetical protein
MDDMRILHSRSLEIRASVFALSTLYVEHCRWDRKNDTTKTSAGRCDRACLELASRAHDCTTRRHVRPGGIPDRSTFLPRLVEFGRADRGSCMALTGEVAGGRRERGRHACFEFACRQSVERLVLLPFAGHTLEERVVNEGGYE